MLSLTVVIPVRNEAEHIAEVLDRLLEQHYDSGKFEIIVADGLSADQTPQIVAGYVQKYPNVRYFENPKLLASAARNIGIRNAAGEVILIIDGHCIIDSKQMLARVSETLEKSGADCLGRPQPLEMTDAAPLQWAVASARRSRLGHHPDSFIYSDQARFAPASSVAVAYRKSVFETVGLFDETFDACEDVEMNTRIDAAGLKCYFEPAIAVRYVPRKTLKGLAYQMFRYGRGRVRLFRKHRHTFSWSGFAPGLFVFGVMSGLPLCFVHWIFLWTYFGVCGLYFAAIIAESLRLTIQQKRADILFRLPFVFLAVHFGYGWGILREWRFALSPR